jgi:hypothetical protein
MGGINVGVTGEAKTAISNALSSAKSGSQTTTQEFTFDKKTGLVTGNDFEDDGFESASIVFGAGDYQSLVDQGILEIGIQDSDDGEFAYMIYTGATSRTVKASVICQATGSRLASTLAITGDDETVQDELCLGGGDYEEIQPCCAVILKRP